MKEGFIFWRIKTKKPANCRSYFISRRDGTSGRTRTATLSLAGDFEKNAPTIIFKYQLDKIQRKTLCKFFANLQAVPCYHVNESHALVDKVVVKEIIKRNSLPKNFIVNVITCLFDYKVKL
jgi:hypothetical protein